MKVFADANVLFSAADTGSATRIVLEALLRHAVVVVNEHVWEEARRNIELKRPRLVGGLERLKSKLQFSGRMMPDNEGLLPDKDQPVLGGATASQCSHLWTGDKRHFGHLYGRTISGTLIVSGTMLADELDRRGSWPGCSREVSRN